MGVPVRTDSLPALHSGVNPHSRSGLFCPTPRVKRGTRHGRVSYTGSVRNVTRLHVINPPLRPQPFHLNSDRVDEDEEDESVGEESATGNSSGNSSGRNSSGNSSAAATDGEIPPTFGMIAKHPIVSTDFSHITGDWRDLDATQHRPPFRPTPPIHHAAAPKKLSWDNWQPVRLLAKGTSDRPLGEHVQGIRGTGEEIFLLWPGPPNYWGFGSVPKNPGSGPGFGGRDSFQSFWEREEAVPLVEDAGTKGAGGKGNKTRTTSRQTSYPDTEYVNKQVIMWNGGSRQLVSTE